jgi:predicted DNA-binding transcriptional regulator YafY
MYNPTMRLLAVLELLQSRREVSAHELAQTLEVDERSVRRYVMMLRDMGIPIDGERGRHGGYTLRPGFRLPPLMFNTGEITAVMLGLLLMRDSGSASLPAIETAIAKIERVLPEEVAHYAGALRQTVKLLEVESASYPVTPEQIIAFSQAAYQMQCLTITYQAGAGDVSERQIAPYGLVRHAQTWYIPAYCYLRQDIRVFRLDRVRTFARSDETFARPADFDAVDYVLKSLARLPGLNTFEILVHAPLTTVQEVVPATLAVLEAAENGTLMRCYSDDPHWLARYLVQLEMPYTVLATDELRAAMRALAEEILSSITPGKT